MTDFHGLDDDISVRRRSFDDAFTREEERLAEWNKDIPGTPDEIGMGRDLDPHA